MIIMNILKRIFQKVIIIINKFEIIHFVPKSYKNEDEVIKKIYDQISTHLTITLIDFNQMILNTFKPIVNIIFGDNAKIETSKGYIKIKSNNQFQNLLFNKNISMYNFKHPIPNYICYLKNNKLILQINLAGFVNKTIKETSIENIINFEIKAIRQNENINAIIQSNRPPENEIDFKIKISKDILNHRKPIINKNYELNGLTIYEYIL